MGYVILHSSIYVVSYFVNSEIKKKTLNKDVSFLFKFCTQMTSSMM